MLSKAEFSKPLALEITGICKVAVVGTESEIGIEL